MKTDPIVDEVRRFRQEYAEKFNFDLRAMVADLQKKQKEHPEKSVSFDSKPVRRRKTA